MQNLSSVLRPYPACLMLLMASPVWAGDIMAQVLSNTGVPLLNAVVYAEPVNKVAADNPVPAQISQKDKTFIPFVSVVQVGATVTFPNNDNVRHHVYSFSPAKTFELKLYSGVPAKPVVFDKPGTVVLGCNIHDRMLAYMQVVDTPYFGKTDASGKVQLKDLPSGKYIVKAWYYASLKENAIVEQAVTVNTKEDLLIHMDTKPL